MLDEKIPSLLETIKRDMKTLEKEVTQLKNEYVEKLKELSKIHKIDLDSEEFKKFLKKSWASVPTRKRNEWWLIIPKWIKFSAGWLDHSDETYNYSIINRYTSWFGEMPEWMREEFGFKKPLDLRVTDGVLSFPEGFEEIIHSRYGGYLTSVGKGKARIKTGKEFDLIANIIESGCLPFVPKPVSGEDLREPQVNFTLSGKYSFQMDAFKKFLETGAVGIYWFTGSGKSFFAMYALDSLNGLKAIITPTRTLIDQWKEYLEKYAPRLLDETIICTYHAWEKIKEKEFTCVVFDESVFLPANTFARLSTLKTKYRIGLTATPHRMDGRTNYVIALTGFPLGQDWSSLMKILGKTYHEVNVHVLKNQTEKIRRVKELVDFDKKTLIFSDGIDFGKTIARKLNTPFIYGATKKRLEVLRKQNVIVVSRVADYGISLKDLEHIIEADFLFSSIRQEVQRSGRLLHSMSKVRVHDILMTEEEFYKYRRRLHGLVEKGFKINIQTFVREPLKLFDAPRRIRKPRTKKPISIKRIKEPRISEEKRKIAKGFIEKKIKKIVKIVNEITPLERRVLKFLIISRRKPFKRISQALGEEINRGNISRLIKNKLVKLDTHGVNYNIKNKISDELSAFKPTSQDINVAVKEIEEIIRSWED
ncbi:MAG: DEAD/DEAH box helicase [Candidatus Hydrothermarchaeota archaeon]